MTATDELRRMLDERGVHWWAGEDERKTLWESNGLTWEYFNDENGDAWLGFLGACESDVTPAQAVAATLGRDADGWACPMCRRDPKPGGTARRVIAGDPATDCATGHCECGACGEPIDPFDAYCRHCGARLEDQ